MRWWPWVVGGAAGLGLLLLGSKASASGGAVAAGSRARVKPNAQNGINTRTAPSPSAPLVAANDAFNDAIVTVLQTGIRASDGSAGEWWRIRTPGGSEGYARAVDPAGNRNFEVAS